MNHFESMEIDDNVDFLFLNFFVAFSLPIGAILFHLHFFIVVNVSINIVFPLQNHVKNFPSSFAIGCANQGL